MQLACSLKHGHVVAKVVTCANCPALQNSTLTVPSQRGNLLSDKTISNKYNPLIHSQR